MTADELNRIRNSLSEKNPLIHCITNPISINQCANALLASGARPIMAEHPDEVSEITEASQSLVINLGNITDARIKSIKISSKTAKENSIPVTLDLVGVACSDLRRKIAYELLSYSTPTLIKGNYSEINAIYDSLYTSGGVDAENSLSTEYISNISVKLAQKYNTIVLASGKTDIITSGKELFYIKNGTPQLAKLTGTGCMLGALCGGFLAVSRDISAVLTACSVLGICGELSETDKGLGSFKVNLMDNLSVLSDEELKNKLKLEERTIEKL